MAHGEAVKSANPNKLVIRNIGLLLSGDLQHTILDADTVVVTAIELPPWEEKRMWTHRRPRSPSTPRARRSPRFDR